MENRMKNNNYNEQAKGTAVDKNFLYNLLFTGRISLKEYLKQLKSLEEQ